eukprot:gnl/TRDRNA2_/TRDRNA2_189917_c0_seq1.p1 gnl/TRDRNA2_/TRDRNA2_189917_c0~~gnl/TRDRNA2_/TRDRNA2_189917_c0_seq1.p1  ORF type:complete len:163 (-),score=49.73 gnl/TRDRNA2_/TRDRNA2_189917_c0_seq1:64-552(-)
MAGWEERNRDEWSKKFIADLFKGACIELEGTGGAKMTFFAIETTGDASLAVKAGAKEPRPIFELKIEIDWKVEQKVDNGKSILETKGQIHVTDFGSEDSGSPQMKLTCDQNLPPGATPAFKGAMQKLHEAVKVQGLPAVQKMLSQDFVNALKGCIVLQDSTS